MSEDRKPRVACKARRSQCRSCQAQVIWCETPKKKNMPVDAEPVADGNLVLYDADGTMAPMAYPATPFDIAIGDPLYRSHFATCEHAEKWRDRS